MGKRSKHRKHDTDRWWMGKVRSLDVGERLRLVPFWERGLHVSERTPVIIDPGPSFGAGDHPTTIMALELLEEVLNEKNVHAPTLLDVGTGTGVLAIAGKLLGTGFTVGLDLDAASVFTARRNLELNGLVLSGRSPVTSSALISTTQTWKEKSPGTEARATEDTDQAHPTSWDGRPCPSSSGAGTLGPPSPRRRPESGHCPGEGSRGEVNLVVGGADCIRGSFHIVTVNLVAPVLLRVKEDLTARARETLILSGIADVMVDAVVAAFGAGELSVSKIKSRDGWNAALLQRSSG
ncbi:MAG: 50S ribosomal protein L11 methyltransferase [Pseudomonadota bacterium]